MDVMRGGHFLWILFDVVSPPMMFIGNRIAAELSGRTGIK